MSASKYRKIPVEIEAMQFFYPPSAELKAWCNSLGSCNKMRHPGAVGEVEIGTLEDGTIFNVKHIASEGDWIVKGIDGEFYPVKPGIFKKTYEKVEEQL